jgi:tetrathionate reductase subunit A
MGLAQELGAPGYGPGALADGSDFTHADHLYLKLAANLAFGERADGGDAVREADDAEVDAFLQARRHLPASVYDPARWMQIVGDDSLWRRTVYMLNRGGRFEDFGAAFAANGKIARRYGQQLNLYLEKLAQARNSMTGAPYHPLATYLPPYLDALGRPVGDDDYEFTLITHRIPTMTKSRTISNYWLLNVRPENHIEVAAADAARLGLSDDQFVRVVSASNPEGAWPLGNGHTKPLVGKVKVREGLRPGTVTFALGYGHWGYGAGEIEIDGKRIEADRRRQVGIQANAAMRIDPHLGDVALSDLVGGSVVFYETKVRLEPA